MERKALRRQLEIISDTAVCGHYFFVIKPVSDPTRIWETNTFAASCHARLNVAARYALQDNAVNPYARQTAICYQFVLQISQNGCWLLVQGQQRPGKPQPHRDYQSRATTTAALPACQTKLSVISRVTISQAATEPAITPNTAVAKPIIRYSSA